MAKRGPKPQEIETPTPLPGIPTPPTKLDAVGKRYWREVTGKMHEAGLLSELDCDILVLYCSTWSLWWKASEELKTGGLVIDTPNYYKQKNPAFDVLAQLSRDLRTLTDSLGLSPKARTRIKVAEAEIIESKWVEPEGDS